MFLPAGQQGGNSPSCTDMIKQWWTTVPFFNRAIVWGCTGIYLLSWFFPLIDTYGINSPAYTIEKFQLWRIFTACFVHVQLLQLVFCVISLIPTSAIAERAQGSTIFILNFMTEAVLIQTLFSLISFVLSFVINIEGFSFYSAGLWSLVMVNISLRSFASPEQETNFLCFPIQIKQKYYPWLILLLFSIFSLFQIIDLFCGIIVAYIELKYFNQKFINLSQQKAKLYEDKYFASVKNNETYIKIENAGQDNSMQESYSERRDEEAQEQQRNQPAFGGSGVAIGANRNEDAQNKIDEFHRERIAAQQRRLEQLQQNSASQPEQIKEQPKQTELKPFSGKGISLAETSQYTQIPKNKDGYVSLENDSKEKEENSFI